MNLSSKILLISICIISQTTFATELERRFINPPQLATNHIGKHVICYRPMRQGSPAMNIERQNDKIIANDYGHGGSGWTLGPGSAKYVINLLQQNVNEADFNKQTPIAIVGSGVIGLFTALELYNQGYTNITIYADKFNDLASHNAGGLLAPVSMDNNSDTQKVVAKIGIEAYKFYSDIAQNKNKQLKNGVKIMPAYFSSREESGLEPYVGKVMQPAKDVLVDFKNGTTHKMVVYDDGIFFDTQSLMQSLHSLFKQYKIKFVKLKVNNFSDIKQNIIFNCSGIGAKQLNNDKSIVSVQGHLMMLKMQNPQDINYMMLTYFGEGKTKSNQYIKRSFYIFPKQAPDANPGDIGVIGGTFVDGADSDTPNDEEFEIMLQAARKFYGLQNN